jgi:hypothetical protein
MLLSFLLRPALPMSMVLHLVSMVALTLNHTFRSFMTKAFNLKRKKESAQDLPAFNSLRPPETQTHP